jgi:hypothetical protein
MPYRLRTPLSEVLREARKAPATQGLIWSFNLPPLGGSQSRWAFAGCLVIQTYEQHWAGKCHIDCGHPSARYFAKRGRHPLILDAFPDLSMTRDGAFAGCLPRTKIGPCFNLLAVDLGSWLGPTLCRIFSI